MPTAFTSRSLLLGQLAQLARWGNAPPLEKPLDGNQQQIISTGVNAIADCQPTHNAKAGMKPQFGVSCCHNTLRRELDAGDQDAAAVVKECEEAARAVHDGEDAKAAVKHGEDLAKIAAELVATEGQLTEKDQAWNAAVDANDEKQIAKLHDERAALRTKRDRLSARAERKRQTQVECLERVKVAEKRAFNAALTAAKEAVEKAPAVVESQLCDHIAQEMPRLARGWAAAEAILAVPFK